MKLRNKKTGEIKEYTHTMTSYHVPIKGGYEIFTPWYPEEWEELEDVREPLTKDEKARKLVLAWAECCCVPLVKHYLSNGLSCFICNDEEGNDYCLDFTFRINNLEAEHIYSVKEL